MKKVSKNEKIAKKLHLKKEKVIKQKKFWEDEKKKMDDENKKIEDLNLVNDEIIELNVGGVTEGFTVTKSLLCSI